MVFERIETEKTHRIQVRDLVYLRIGQVLYRLPQVFRNLRPQGVRVRIVALVRDGVLADGMNTLQAEGIVNEAVEKVSPECLTRLFRLEYRVGPNLVPPAG